jgi:predicted dehydrogenase/threonine dehydrogenase-like Zn-dependent dehydrogenase
MKQLLQNLNSGETVVETVPVPRCGTDAVLIETALTLVSAGTERMLVDFGKGNLIQKARSQPDKVKQVLEKAKTDGVAQTIDTVRNKLDTPLPLGYCNVGIVEESKTESFVAGDRVVSNGKHAEYVVVPKNLCAKIPDSVDDESAAFTVLGAIALQGIRLIKPTLGETVVVTGLGLIGLIAVQLLRAHGCRVLGIDFDASKCALAKQFGAEVVDLSKGQDAIATAQQYSRNRGVDAVLITASTKSNEPIHQAATMCRQRGRIVLVGVVGMEMSRADFYEKELSFQVSCSYGPGRYDENYEEKGNDYPMGFVRWTEQRNFEAILDMMADGRLDMRALISHRYTLDQASEAYALISKGSPLGVLLTYEAPKQAAVERKVLLSHRMQSEKLSRVCLGFVGAGGYASSVLAPAFAKSGAKLKSIASATGVSSVHLGKKFGFKEATTDAEALFGDDEINGLVVSTRHNSHANWVLKGLEANKHIFVEKPLAITQAELDEIAKCYNALEKKSVLMVGFNRRYSPLIQSLKSALRIKRQPKTFIYTANVGAIPEDHWIQDRAVGGGRIVGEACHFIDLLRYLAGSSITNVTADALPAKTKDTVSIQLTFEDGSVGSIHYFANGSKSFPKERLEVFCGGSIAVVDNFRTLKGYGWRGLKTQRLWKQDKGQVNCVSAFVQALESGDDSTLIPIEELLEVSAQCIKIDEQIN